MLSRPMTGLHSMIADSCGNQRLKEEIFRYPLAADEHSTRRGRSSLSVHLLRCRNTWQIIEALLRRDVEQAVEAMKRHILSSAKICGDVLFPPAKENN